MSKTYAVINVALMTRLDFITLHVFIYIYNKKKVVLLVVSTQKVK